MLPAASLVLQVYASLVPWAPHHQAPYVDLVAVKHMERWPLGSGAVPGAMEFDAAANEITLWATPGQSETLAHSASRSTLCGQARVEGDRVVLRCNSRRVEPHMLTPPGGTPILEIRLRRGAAVTVAGWRMPWMWELWAQDADCKNLEPLERARCALKKHRLDAAIGFLMKASDDVDNRGVTSMMLAELAASQGTAARALGWYQRAQGDSAWLLAARLGECELTGNCATVLATWRASIQMLSPLLRHGVELRLARVHAQMLDPVHAALTVVDQQEAAQGAGGPCDISWDVCLAVVGAALHDGRPDQMEAVVAAYLRLTSTGAGQPTPLDVAVALKCAARMEDLHVPLLAGRLRAAQTPRVPKALLEQHLHATVMDFLWAGDAARAQTVTDYVRDLYGAHHLQSALWRDVLTYDTSARTAEDSDHLTAWKKATFLAEVDLAGAKEVTARASRVTSAATRPPP